MNSKQMFLLSDSTFHSARQSSWRAPRGWMMDKRAGPSSATRWAQYWLKGRLHTQIWAVIVIGPDDEWYSSKRAVKQMNSLQQYDFHSKHKLILYNSNSNGFHLFSLEIMSSSFSQSSPNDVRRTLGKCRTGKLSPREREGRVTNIN